MRKGIRKKKGRYGRYAVIIVGKKYPKSMKEARPG